MADGDKVSFEEVFNYISAKSGINLITLLNFLVPPNMPTTFGSMAKLSHKEVALKSFEYMIKAWDNYICNKGVFLLHSDFIKGKTYQFKDTFQDYLDGKITSCELELIPHAVYHNSTSRDNRRFTYNRPILDTYASGIFLYGANHPMTIGDDIDNSYLYFFDLNNELLMSYFSWKAIEQVNNNYQAVKLNGEVEFFSNITDIISNLKDEYTNRANYRPSIERIAPYITRYGGLIDI